MKGRGTAHRAVEGRERSERSLIKTGARAAPPPPSGRSPSPAKAGEDFPAPLDGEGKGGIAPGTFPFARTVRAEPVEAPRFPFHRKKDSPSTSSGRTVWRTPRGKFAAPH
jgi:hypothetical protein